MYKAARPKNKYKLHFQTHQWTTAFSSGHRKAAIYLTNTALDDAKKLGKMRDERNDADHKMLKPGFDLTAAQNAVRYAARALKRLSTLDKAKLKADVDRDRRTVDRTLPPLS